MGTVDLATVIAVVSAMVSVAALIATLLLVQFERDSVMEQRIGTSIVVDHFYQDVCLRDTDLVYSVDGLDKGIPPDEAKRIHYLGGILVEAQYRAVIHWGLFYKRKNIPGVLRTLFTVRENWTRWEVLKKTYGHAFSKRFAGMVDEIIADERERLRKDSLLGNGPPGGGHE